MCRAHRNWYRKFVQFHIKAALYSSWVLGLFPFKYVSRMKKLKRSKWLVGYGIILNVVMVWVALENFRATESESKKEIYKRNPLVYQISEIHNALLLITIFVTYFRNWWMSAEFGKILNLLLRLHHQHFKEFDASDCNNFNNYIVYKGSCIMMELISMIIMEILLAHGYSFRMLMGVLSILIMQLGVLLVSMHFHLAVMYIYRSVWIINRELLRLVNHLRIYPTTKSNEVHKLHKLYKRLLDLNAQLVAIYDYQITLLMMSLLGVNIVSPFYMIVYTISLKHPVTIYLVVNYLQAISINIIDFWLNIAVCELNVRASQGTARILKLFNDIPNLCKDLERSITDFALFSSKHRLKYNHFGMFDVHNALGFRMVIACALYLVYLVQFDFMNL